MKRCEALIIGGSAGSLEVLLHLLPELSASLSFPVIIILHRKPGRDSLLTDLLQSKTKLVVKEAQEKDTIKKGTIYVAPSDYHLLFEADQSFSLDASEKINFSRPSIDVSFESAAQVYKENLFALLLSGSNNDGSTGLSNVKKHGGTIAIQNPETAIAAFMPASAEKETQVDDVLDQAQMANYINKLVS